MNKITKNLLWVTVVAVASLFVLGCATVEGVGEDVETIGEEVQEAAE